MFRQAQHDNQTVNLCEAEASIYFFVILNLHIIVTG